MRKCGVTWESTDCIAHSMCDHHHNSYSLGRSGGGLAAKQVLIDVTSNNHAAFPRDGHQGEL